MLARVKIKLRILILVLPLVYLLADILFDRNGLVAYYGRKAEKKELRVKKYELDQQIKDLEVKIVEIKSDLFTQEKISREERGLAKRDEDVYIFNDTKK